MRLLSLLEGERKSGASRYIVFRQSPERGPAHGPTTLDLDIGRKGRKFSQIY